MPHLSLAFPSTDWHKTPKSASTLPSAERSLLVKALKPSFAAPPLSQGPPHPVRKPTAHFLENLMLRAPVMLTRSSSWQLPSGRTVPVALALLGASVLVHLFLAGWGFYLRSAASVEAPRTDLFRAEAFKRVEPPDTPPSLLVQPRMDSLHLRSPWQELLEQSRASAANRQPEAAFKALTEAEAQLPRQPDALAEIAVQYEKMGSPAQAIKLWEMVYQFGPAAGVYHAAADAKLSILKDFNPSTPPPVPAPAPAAPLPKPGLLRFGKFGSVQAAGSTPIHRAFTLNIPVQRAEHTSIAATDIFIQVQFYDQINARSLERTNATVSWKWSKTPVDWTSNRTQTLQVGYVQGPKRTTKEVRRFYGYVASVYYHGKLLDTRADPPLLGHQYPPPRMISKEGGQ